MFIFFLHISLFFLVLYRILSTLRFKNPSSIAWLLFSFFVPLGGILFFLIGVRSIKFLGFGLYSKMKSQRFNFSNESFPLTKDNSAKFLEDDEIFQAMLNAITKAKRKIYLCTYIFINDEVGEKIINALINAHNRGVKVYFLTDAIGSIRFVLSKKSRNLPFNYQRFFSLDILPFLPYSNIRLHSKLLVIDHAQAIISSSNLFKRILPNQNRDILPKTGVKRPSRNVAVELFGDASKQIRDLFIYYWFLASNEKLDSEKTEENPILEKQNHYLKSDIQTLFRDPANGYNNLIYWFLNSISSAKKSVKIVTPYLVIPREIQRMLEVVAKNNIKVDIFIPLNSDQTYVPYAMSSQYEILFKRGINVHLVDGDFNHSKIILIDEKLLNIGSNNFNSRSFLIDFELSLLIQNSALIEKVADYISTLKQNSKKFHPSQCSIFRKYTSRFLFLFLNSVS